MDGDDETAAVTCPLPDSLTHLLTYLVDLAQQRETAATHPIAREVEIQQRAARRSEEASKRHRATEPAAAAAAAAAAA